MTADKTQETASERAQEMIRDIPQGKMVLAPDPTDACPVLIGAPRELWWARVEHAQSGIVINLETCFDGSHRVIDVFPTLPRCASS